MEPPECDRYQPTLIENENIGIYTFPSTETSSDHHQDSEPLMTGEEIASNRIDSTDKPAQPGPCQSGLDNVCIQPLAQSILEPLASELSTLAASDDRHEVPLGASMPSKGFIWPQTETLLTVTGSLEGHLCKKPILADGGAGANFVSACFVTKHRLDVQELKQAFKIRLADGRTMSSSCFIKAHLELQSKTDVYSGTHQLMVLEGLAQYDIILGRPFLKSSRARVDHESDTITWPAKVSQSAQVSDGVDEKPAATQANDGISRAQDSNETAQSAGHETGNESIRQQLQDVIADYREKLAPLKDKLPPSRGAYDHSIQLKDPSATPPRLPSIKQKPAHAKAMKEQLDKLLQDGKIRPSKSPYGAPAFMVEQGGKLRMVMNYKRLNEQTVTNATTLPHIEELLARLTNAKVASKLDLTSGFHQLLMAFADREKTAFTTPFGHFEWVVMPFGEKNAPAAFVQLLNQLVLVDLVHDFIIVFVDDILIFSANEEEHVQHVREVLKRLADHQLFINPDKCDWMVNDVDFLGYRLRVGEDVAKLMIQQNKCKAILDWPVPKNLSQLRSFLGSANFSRAFVENFSTIARRLTDLTAGKHKSKNAVIKWGDEQQIAFDTIKKAITSAPALAIPDETKPFFLYTDASDYGIGATLCQLNEQMKLMQPCGFMSAKLTGAELNWTTHDKEMFALVRALEHWSMHFVQAQHPITVYTDNVAMLYMLRNPDITSKRSRWISVLTRFQLKPQRIEGVKNITADALSRRPDHDGGAAEVQALRKKQAELAMQQLGLNSLGVLEESLTDASQLITEIKSEMLNDKECAKMLQDPDRYHLKLVNGLLLDRNDRVRVPASAKIRSLIISEAHDTNVSGHLGIAKTVARIHEHFEWPGLVTDVNDYVASCAECQTSKAQNLRPAGLLQPITTPMTKGLTISVDFVGPLPRTSRRKDFIMTINDKYSKRAWYIPTRQTIDAKEAANIIFNTVVRHQGLPEVIISDRDPRFTGKIWKELWKECGTRLAMTVTYRAQANGSSETNNKTMQDMLRNFVNDARNDWDLKLGALEIAYNSSINSTTGHSPFQLDIGMQPRLPLDIALQSNKSSLPVSDFMQRWENSWVLAHKHIAVAQERQKRAFDKTRRTEEYRVGDKAWLRLDRQSLNDGLSAVAKLGPRVEGPYTVTELHGDSNVTLQLPKGDRRHNRFNISQLRPFVPRDTIRFPLQELTKQTEEYDATDARALLNDPSKITNGNNFASRPSHEQLSSDRVKRSRKSVDPGFFLRH